MIQRRGLLLTIPALVPAAGLMRLPRPRPRAVILCQARGLWPREELDEFRRMWTVLERAWRLHLAEEAARGRDPVPVFPWSRMPAYPLSAAAPVSSGSTRLLPAAG